MLEYEGFREMSLDKSNTTIKLIDDCGNRWDCYQVYQSMPENLFKIGGQWKRMVDARRIKHLVYMKLGAPTAGNNRTFYISFRPI